MSSLGAEGAKIASVGVNLGGMDGRHVYRVRLREIQDVWPCDVLTTDVPIDEIGQVRAHVLRTIRAGIFGRCHA